MIARKSAALKLNCAHISGYGVIQNLSAFSTDAIIRSEQPLQKKVSLSVLDRKYVKNISIMIIIW